MDVDLSDCLLASHHFRIEYIASADKHLVVAKLLLAKVSKNNNNQKSKMWTFKNVQSKQTKLLYKFYFSDFFCYNC